MGEDAYAIYRDRTLSIDERAARLSAIAEDEAAADRDQAREYLSSVALEVRSIERRRDEHLAAATRWAAREVREDPKRGTFLERCLEDALIAGWDAAVPGGRADRNVQLEVPGWDPQPGRTDWVAREPEADALAAFAELKVEKIEEALWDLLKVACILEQAPAALSGYLVIAATPRRWQRAEVADLFTRNPAAVGGEQEWDTSVLIATWRSSWRYLLDGGRARPVTVPARIRTRLVAAAPLEKIDGYELRCIRVEPIRGAGHASFTDGWPIDTGDLVTTRDLMTAEEEERSLRDGFERQRRRILERRDATADD